ncbi:glycosyltransferase family 2 protein [Tautonia plasticadhaerens]|uniref:Glycosyltransferase CsbB n=1 Tax=Tautonia plasticadhaerens TaxID=2527974 RepID=A0A518H3R1_9BACT|nr:glycosyltransferase family 2 protein [Tautonia plasticadhaerens]QDV35470.1 Putative glycosyltransferase CsbB [Tautonia plasticadhaerens]
MRDVHDLPESSGPTPPSRGMISVVSPVFNEEDNVGDCHRAVREVFERDLPDYDYEHVFCDNCSTDRTVARLRDIAEADPRVRVIVNARNFGPFRSTFNGLMATRGDAVLVLLAADLQDPPELIPEFVRCWEAGHEVVYGIKARREEGAVLRLVRKVYYRMVSRFADITIPTDVSEFQLVDRVIIDALRRCDDHYPYIRGLIANCGFRVVGVPYTWRARRKGFSKNRLYHLIDQGLNGLISFTNVPMRLCMFVGLLASGFSLLAALATLIIHLARFREVAPPGIPTLIVAVFFFSGLQLFFFGVLGEYIASIHFQVRKRPLVIERERINFGHGQHGPIEARRPTTEVRRSDAEPQVGAPHSGSGRRETSAVGRRSSGAADRV